MRCRRAVASRVAPAALLLALGAPAGAQLPGLPVLQSPFVAPQRAAAVNGGRTGDDGASAVGIAAAWSPASARLQVSGGVAAVKRRARTGVGGGARAYLPLRSFAGETVAAGVFLGAGGDQAAGVRRLTAALGASVGYRRALGATRAVSVYAAPFYGYNRVNQAGANSSLLRVSVGADVLVVRRVGLSLGLETGQTPGAADPGPGRLVTGAGLSYAF